MLPEHIRDRKVLYGCLDWGSGHVARSIPLILQLEQQGNKVFFCGSADQYAILLQYGVAATLLELPPTGFRFKGDGNFVKEALRNAFVLRKAVRRERKQTARFVREQEIDVVISDHRYGLHVQEIPTVFITHQVQLPPGTNKLAQRIHCRWRDRFATIWILDDPENRLAGTLSISCSNAYYIGHRSRFSHGQVSPEKKGSIVAIASGPEPYRSQLNSTFHELATASGLSWTILSNVSDWKQADEAIRSAEWIVSRNGYSTLMDLKALGKKAVLIPTPGQGEQEYLAKINDVREWIYVETVEGLKKVMEDHEKTSPV
jgi:hypothetical protein